MWLARNMRIVPHSTRDLFIESDRLKKTYSFKQSPSMDQLASHATAKSLFLYILIGGSNGYNNISLPRAIRLSWSRSCPSF